ncbi:MAG: hypothetical protein IT361_08095 [Gemmatimonadaceae bacterium]|nr:hypothetical protein [Gemmatimonadaceae bacterium]
MRAASCAIMLAGPMKGDVCTAMAQAAAGRGIPSEQLDAIVRTYPAIDTLRERANAELADPRNTSTRAQEKLRAKLRLTVRQVLREQGLTDEELDRFSRRTRTDTAERRAFDDALARLRRSDGLSPHQGSALRKRDTTLPMTRFQ